MANGNGSGASLAPQARWRLAGLEVVEPTIPRRRSAPSEPLPEALPVLPLRETVTFPDTLTPLAVGQERSMKLVDDVLGGNRMLAMVASRDPEEEEPGPDELYDVGVAGVVARMLKVPDGTIRILVQGTQRVAARRPTSPSSPTWSPGSPSCPTWSSPAPELRGADPQRPAHLLGDHRADPLPARGAADGGRQHRRPLGARAT